MPKLGQFATQVFRRFLVAGKALLDLGDGFVPARRCQVRFGFTLAIIVIVVVIIGLACR